MNRDRLGDQYTYGPCDLVMGGLHYVTHGFCKLAEHSLYFKTIRIAVIVM